MDHWGVITGNGRSSPQVENRSVIEHHLTVFKFNSGSHFGPSSGRFIALTEIRATGAGREPQAPPRIEGRSSVRVSG